MSHFEKKLFGVLKSLVTDSTDGEAFFGAEILDHEFQKFTRRAGARLDSVGSFEVALDWDGEWRRHGIEQRLTLWCQITGDTAAERYEAQERIIRMTLALAAKIEADRTIGGSVFDSRVLRGAVKYDNTVGTAYWIATVLVLANEISQAVTAAGFEG